MQKVLYIGRVEKATDQDASDWPSIANRQLYRFPFSKGSGPILIAKEKSTGLPAGKPSGLVT
jgi:hypothetical protein